MSRVQDYMNMINVVDEFDEFDVEFPVKDRSTSRKHYFSRRRAKLRHKMPNHHDSGKLHYAFDYLRGDLSKNIAVLEKAKLDEREFADEPIAWVVAESENGTRLCDVLPMWSSDALYKRLNDLKSKGIYISGETLDAVLEEFLRRDYKRELDNERKIVAYQVLKSDRFEYYSVGDYETEEEANKIIEILQQRDEDWEYFCVPVKVYTEEQKRECKSLGYLPTPGFEEI